MKNEYLNTFKEKIKGKKITIMGLGLLGRGVGIAEFLAQQGLELIVTDLKTRDELRVSIDRLAPYEGQITYILGRHDLSSFLKENTDILIYGCNVPSANKYLAHARNEGIEMYMDELFLMSFLDERITTIGVTGTRGKSTVTMMLRHILKAAGKRIHLGGNIRGISNIPLITKVQPGDILLFELSSWQLVGWRNKEVSPNISVFTNFMEDHMNYYKNDFKAYWDDKAAIFTSQNTKSFPGKDKDVIIFGPQFSNTIKLKAFDSAQINFDALYDSLPHKISDKVLINKSAKEMYGKDFETQLAGEHNQDNISCVYEVAKKVGLTDEEIRKHIASFKGVEGRQEIMGTIKGVRIINDNNATTPDATKAALDAFGDPQKLILIAGGASKQFTTDVLLDNLEKSCKSIIWLDNTGTQEILAKVPSYFTRETYVYDRLPNCVEKAFEIANEGDTIMLSPAFASFGEEFKNEYERNDLFVEIIKEKIGLGPDKINKA